jgi:hypothetical protein
MKDIEEKVKVKKKSNIILFKSVEIFLISQEFNCIADQHDIVDHLFQTFAHDRHVTHHVMKYFTHLRQRLTIVFVISECWKCCGEDRTKLSNDGKLSIETKGSQSIKTIDFKRNQNAN